MPKVDMTHADLVVAPNVKPEHARWEKSQYFLEGNGPLPVPILQPWWWSFISLGAVTTFALLLWYSFDVWEFFWAQNFVVFLIMGLSFCVVPFNVGVAILSLRNIREPRRPSHVLLGRIAKLGYAANGGPRRTTVRFQSPRSGTTTAKISTFPGQYKKNQQVAVLYYGDRTIALL